MREGEALAGRWDWRGAARTRRPLGPGPPGRARTTLQAPVERPVAGVGRMAACPERGPRAPRRAYRLRPRRRAAHAAPPHAGAPPQRARARGGQPLVRRVRRAHAPGRAAGAAQRGAPPRTHPRAARATERSLAAAADVEPRERPPGASSRARARTACGRTPPRPAARAQAVDRDTLLSLRGCAAKGFAFDRRFGPECTSDDIYDSCVAGLVDSLFKVQGFSYIYEGAARGAACASPLRSGL